MKNIASKVLLFFAVMMVAGAPAFGYAPWSGGGSSSAVKLPTGLCSQSGVAWTTGSAYSASSVVIPSTAAKQTGYYYVPIGACTSGATEPASWPNAIGTTVSDGGCTYTTTGPTSCGGTVWVEALDFDFTAPGAQTFSTDGSVSFGGLTWTKFGSACETTHASAGGGTGLSITPNASTCVLSLASRTLPGLYLPLSNLNIPGLTWRTPVRAWLYIASQSGNANSGPGFAGDGPTFAWVSNVAGMTTANGLYLMQAASLAFNAGQGLEPGWDQQTYQDNTATGVGGPFHQSFNGTFLASTILLEQNLGFLGVKATYYVGWNLAPWPSVQSMITATQTPQGIAADNRIPDFGLNGGIYNALPSPASFASVKNAGVAIAVSRGDSGAVNAVFNRLRIDYQPNVE